MDDEHICPQNKEQQAVCKQSSSAYECLCVSACLAFVFFYIHLGLKSNSMNQSKKIKKERYIHHFKPTIRKSVFVWNFFISLPLSNIYVLYANYYFQRIFVKDT